MGSKVNINNYKLTGYHRTKRFTIDLIIFLLREAIPVYGAVMVMSVCMGAALGLVGDNMIGLPFLGALALLILMSVCHLISKKISGTAERLYGKQELYLIHNDLYCTTDVRTRMHREIRCCKLIEIYQMKKTRFYWETDCLCYEIRKICNAREDIEATLQNLMQDEKNLTPIKEILLFKGQYDNETEKRIDDVFNNHKP